MMPRMNPVIASLRPPRLGSGSRADAQRRTFARVAQVRQGALALVHTEEVTGSNPVSPTV
jgi:hypothetical protein